MGMMTRRNVKARTVVVEKPVEKKVEEKTEEKVEKPDYSSMPYFSLKSEAKKRGIKVEGKKAAQLREELSALEK